MRTCSTWCLGQTHPPPAPEGIHLQSLRLRPGKPADEDSAPSWGPPLPRAPPLRCRCEPRCWQPFMSSVAEPSSVPQGPGALVPSRTGRSNPSPLGWGGQSQPGTAILCPDTLRSHLGGFKRIQCWVALSGYSEFWGAASVCWGLPAAGTEAATRRPRCLRVVQRPSTLPTKGWERRPEGKMPSPRGEVTLNQKLVCFCKSGIGDTQERAKLSYKTVKKVKFLHIWV